MRRRQLLAAALAGTTAALAAGPRAGRERRVDRPGGVAAAAGPPSGELDLPVPESDLVRAAPRDGIPAITDPAFGDAADWEDLTVGARTLLRGDHEVDLSLDARDRVIGIERNGEARAYPLKLLAWHEVVNDDFGGPLLVTYCPLCGSSVVARRTVAGEPTWFGVSGFLWRENLVLYDERTESLWSQLAATAIRGPETGETFELVPSTVTRLESWLAEHPASAILLPPPRSESVDGETFNYELDRYGAYRASRNVGPESIERTPTDDRLHPKMSVLGVAAGGEAKAYPYAAVEAAGVVNDRVGRIPVVVATGPEDSASRLSGTLVAYDRRVGGRTLEFERPAADRLCAGGSRWQPISGRAVDGPFDGTQLRSTGLPPMMWFAWLDRHPETAVYGAEA